MGSALPRFVALFGTLYFGFGLASRFGTACWAPGRLHPPSTRRTSDRLLDGGSVCTVFRNSIIVFDRAFHKFGLRSGIGANGQSCRCARTEKFPHDV
jgi:hypothetical protein